MTRKRLHTLSHTLLGFILLIALASPSVASAQPPASVNTLTQDDIEFIFGPEANIAAFKQLSPQEMAEIQGEFFRRGWRIFLKDLGSYLGKERTIKLFSGYRVKFGYHSKPHPIEGWGPLSGKRPHYHIRYWKEGQKGSHHDVLIIPMGPKAR